METRRRPRRRARSRLAAGWKPRACSGPARWAPKHRKTRASPRPCRAQMETRTAMAKAAMVFARPNSSRMRAKAASERRAGRALRAGSQTPGELVLRRQTSALVPDYLSATLHGDAAFGRAVDDQRRARLRGDVAQLHAVCVELECARVGQLVHDRHDMRPARRADCGEPREALRTQELLLSLGEQHRLHRSPEPAPGPL